MAARVVVSCAVNSEVRDEFGLTGRRLDERYEVERVVAAGGFGTVYYGHHRALHSPIALKVLRVPPQLTEAEQREFAQRFLAEARTLAQLRHPAVVRALDFGVSAMPNGVTAPWAALEWVEGETLGAFLAARAGAPMAPAACLALLRPVLEALVEAHALGIAHRDIKPANIMVPRHPAGATVSRVLDFGIAKTMHPGESASPSGVTRTGSSMPAFSLKYAAPEQVSGLRTGPWTDVHALGLVLVEALTGRPAYAGDDVMSVTAAVLRYDRPTPAALGVDVGPWEPVLAKALAFRPGDRYPDAASLLAALDAHGPHPDAPAAPRAVPFDATAPMLGPPAPYAAGPSAAPTARTEPFAPLASGAVRHAGPRRGLVVLAAVVSAAIVLSAAVLMAPRGARRDVSDAAVAPLTASASDVVVVTAPDVGMGLAARVASSNPWVVLPDADLQMQTHEVTFVEYRRWREPAEIGADVWPAVQIAWSDAAAFCEALGGGARLPTREEWRGALGPRRWIARVPLVRVGAGFNGDDVAPSGARDLVGGVREWVAEADGPGGHAVMGAAATDPDDEKVDRATVGDVATGPSPVVGFRCVRRVP